MIAALALLLASAQAACGVPPIVDLPVTLGVVTHGQRIGGTGIVTLQSPEDPESTDDTVWSLTLLSPGGLSLFTARGAFGDAAELPVSIDTGLDAWRFWLERLPLGRDLRAAFATRDGACAGGTLRTRADGTPEGTVWHRRWRGPGGPVRVDIRAGRVVVHDRLRGYTLTLVSPDLPHPPEAGA